MDQEELGISLDALWSWEMRVCILRSLHASSANGNFSHGWSHCVDQVVDWRITL